jgi:hypothetical protein
LNPLPQLWHPVFESARFARASRDRFFLFIQASDPRLPRLDKDRVDLVALDAFFRPHQSIGIEEVYSDAD